MRLGASLILLAASLVALIGRQHISLPPSLLVAAGFGLLAGFVWAAYELSRELGE